MQIVKATLKDIKSIHATLQEFAKEGQLLGRPLAALYERVREFFICFNEKNELIGCVALSIIWEDLAEVRSLAVKKQYQKNGIGKKLVEACLKEAKSLKLKQIFTLTYRPEFFQKSGFKLIDKHLLPHKIWADCINCPEFPDCNEIALLIEL